MKLREIYRQPLAGTAASVIFLALFFGMRLVWWISLVLSGCIYGAIILIVPRQRETDEIEVDTGTTQADVEAAVDFCRRGASALRKFGETPKLEPEMSQALKKLAGLAENIAEEYGRDPRSLRHSRGLVDHHLGKLLEITERYCTLCCQSLSQEARARLDHIRGLIIGYVPNFEAIYNACLENDFQELEIQTVALGQILKAEAPVDMMKRGN